MVGILTDFADKYTGKTSIQDSKSFVGALDTGMNELQQTIMGLPAFTPNPANPLELAYAERNLINNGDGTFSSPEKAMAEQQLAQISALRKKATEDYERKRQNPFFNLNDLGSDVIRGLLGGDYDPSKKLDRGYQDRMVELSKLREGALQKVVDARNNRFGSENGAKVISVPFKNQETGAQTYYQELPDGTVVAKPVLTESGQPVFASKTAVVDIGGVPTLVDVNDMSDSRSTVPLSTVQSEADSSEQIAQASSRGSTTGKGQGQAQIDVRGSIDSANQMLASLRSIKNDPALDAVFRNPLGSLNPSLYVPNTPERDFAERLKQLQGGVFMQAYETLKGGGQITEIEGQKAEVSLANMAKAQTKEQFLENLAIFEGIVIRAAENTLRQAQGDFMGNLPTLNIEGVNLEASGVNPNLNILQTPNGNSYRVIEND